MSFKSFSQTDTQPYVKLTTEQARQVIKDIIAGEAAIQQVELQSRILSEKDITIATLDSLVGIQKEKINYGANAIASLESLTHTQTDQIDALEKSFKKANRWRKVFKTGFVVTSVALITLILAN